MMSAQQALTRCPTCSDVLGMSNVVGTTSVSADMLAVGMICGRCRQASHLKIARADWRVIVANQTPSPPLGSGSTDPVQEVDQRQVGRVVKAFRQVDLAPVLYVEDLELYWDYQAQTDPKSIPVEV